MSLIRSIIQWYIGLFVLFFFHGDFLIWLGIIVSSMLCVGWTLLFWIYFPINFCTDAHAIYLLNLLLAFLQPKFDPSLQDDLMADEIEEGGDPVLSPLPSQRDDEFRPFVRRLPEWQFWWASSPWRGCCCALTYLHFQAIIHPCYISRSILHFFGGFRCSGVLAYLGCLFFRSLCADHAQTNTVIYFFISSKNRLLMLSRRHMIKYKYIPFDIGRKARYGRAK